MQQLHLVGFTTDLDGLIFSARRGSKSGSFVIDLDEELLERVEEALRLRADSDGEGGYDESDEDEDGDDPRHPSAGSSRRRAAKPRSHLSPREIQARLRAGRTIAEVAKEASVDEEWVTRFADPILAEQAQVVGRAREMVSSKQRLGESAQNLLTSVLWNLADKGMSLTEAEFESGWSAYHSRESTWVVRFVYISRRRQQVAEWEVDLGEEELHPRNRLASDLGYVESGGRRRRVTFAVAPAEDAAEPEAKPARAATTKVTKRPATKKKKAAAKKVAARRPAKKATAKKATATRKATAKKATTKKAAAKKKKATTARAPARKTPTKKKATAKRAPAKKATTKKATTKKATAKRAPTKKKAAPAATTVRNPVGGAPAVMPSPAPSGGRRPPPRATVSRAGVLPQPIASSRPYVPQPVVSRSTARPIVPQPTASRPPIRPTRVDAAGERSGEGVRLLPRDAPVRANERPPRQRREPTPAADSPRVVFDDVAGVLPGEDARPVVRIRADQAGPSATPGRSSRRRRMRPQRD